MSTGMNGKTNRNNNQGENMRANLKARLQNRLQEQAREKTGGFQAPSDRAGERVTSVSPHRKVLSVALAVLLVLTMNPLIEMDLSAWAAPADSTPAPVENAGVNGFQQGALDEFGANSDGLFPGDGTGNGESGVGGGAGSGEDGSGGESGSALPDDKASELPDADNPEAEENVVYSTWLEVVKAVEEGKLAGEGYKPEKTAYDKAGNPAYLVSTPEAFAWWALLHADESAVLDADIDLTLNEHASGKQLANIEGSQGAQAVPTPVDPAAAAVWPGNTELSAELDGRSHTLVYNGEGAGLFSKVAATGAVRWLFLGADFKAREAAETAGADPELLRRIGSVSSKDVLAGSVAGVNEGEIRGVVNRMDVSAQPKEAGAQSEPALVGGLVAENNGVIRDSANLGSVRAGEHARSVAAGIAAKGTGTIAQSYNAGDVRSKALGAPLVTDLSKPGEYASLVDESCAYLESAVYENVDLKSYGQLPAASQEAGSAESSPEAEAVEGAEGEGAAADEGIAAADEPAAAPASRYLALSFDDLKAASERLNAGREGEATVWQAGTKDAARELPVPGIPADGEGALPSPVEALFIEPLAATYTTWYKVGKAVHDGVITSSATKPLGNVKFDGLGTAEDPWTIDTPEALAYLAYVTNERIAPYANPGSSFMLISDLDLSGRNYSTSGGNLHWVSIGHDSDKAFSSNFEGSFFTISNLTQVATSQMPYGEAQYGGLFGYVQAWNISITIQNFYLKDTNLDFRNVADLLYVGGAVGKINTPGSGRVTMSRVGVMGNSVVQAHYKMWVGGLVGLGQGVTDVLDCFSLAKVTPTSRSGGLVGMAFDNHGGSIKNSYFGGSAVDNPVGSSLPTTVSNVYYKTGSATKTQAPAVQVSDATMKSASFVSSLNNGRTDFSAAWQYDTKNRNQGYPTFYAITSWEEVAKAIVDGKINNPAVGSGSVKFAGGNGTQESPYLIDTAESLAYLSYMVKTNNATYNAAGVHYKLKKDVDLSGRGYTKSARRLAWLPIGTNANKFKGNFDGGLFSASGLSVPSFVDTDGRDGLFGSVQPAAGHPISIKDLYLKDVKLVRPASSSAGALAGLLDSSNAAITVSRVGAVSGVIYAADAGGLVGFDASSAANTSIQDCFSMARLAGSTRSGGITGNSSTAQNISNCYYAGGNARYAIDGANRSTNLSNNYYQNTSATASHSNGTASRTAAQMKAQPVVASLNADRNDANPVWFVDLNNRNNGYPQYTPFQLSNWEEVAKAIDAGVITDTASGTGSVKFARGNGTKSSPYVIDSPEGLAYFAYQVNQDRLGTLITKPGLYFHLAADIDLSGTYYTGKSNVKLSWRPIGGGQVTGRPFSGHFDGNLFTVSNLYTAPGSFSTTVAPYDGLFGGIAMWSDRHASLQNLYLKDVSLNRTEAQYSGALVGYFFVDRSNESFVSKVGMTSGTVKGTVSGGLVGRAGSLNAPLTFNDCFSTGTVTGSSKSGGLTGEGTFAYYNDSYFAGSGARSAIDGGKTEILASNTYYRDGSATNGNGTKVTKKSAEDMQASKFVSTLNRGRTGSDVAWFADVKGKNKKYPIYDSFSSWREIGEAVASGDLTTPVGGSGSVLIGGQGTESDPYTVNTPEALAYLSVLVQTGATDMAGNKHGLTGTHYKLTGNIDLGGELYTGSGRLDWLPLGSASAPFKSSFDGNMHVISNLSISGAAATAGSYGLFGTVALLTGEDEVVLEGIVLDDPSINRTDGASGALAGELKSEGPAIAISRIGVKGGAVSGGTHVGGVVGNDASNGAVSYEDLFSRSALSGAAEKAGIVAETALARTFSSCYFAGSGAMWGMSGSGSGTFEKCYVLSGAANAGAEQGQALSSDNMKTRTFAADLNRGRGGIQAVWGVDSLQENDSFAYFGALSGWEQIGQYVASGRISAPSSGSTVKFKGGDGSSENPYLIDSPEALAYMSYLVKTDNAGYGAKSYKLAANIDLAGTVYTGDNALNLEWLPIGSLSLNAEGGVIDTKFTGTFDGGYFTVSNMTLVETTSAADRAGFFGQLDSGATITKTYLSGVNVSRTAPADKDAFAGTLVGTIANGTPAGNVIVSECGVLVDPASPSKVAIKQGSANSVAGGLVGMIEREANTVAIADCFTSASLENLAASQRTAGLVGGSANAQTLKSSYFAGSGADFSLSGNGAMVGLATNYFAEGSLAAGGSEQGSMRTQEQMAKSLFTADLNGSRIGSAAPWTFDFGNANSGYPLFGHTIASWQQVGGAVASSHITETSPQGKNVKFSGTGTAGDPWTINSPEALAYLAYLVNTGTPDESGKQHGQPGQYYQLASNVDLTGAAYAGAGKTLDWMPIGLNGAKPFQANFLGDLHKVSNLTISASVQTNGNDGLFGVVSPDAVGLTIDGVQFDGVLIDRASKAGSRAGALAGSVVGGAGGKVDITRIGLASGAIKSDTAGGLVGADEAASNHSNYKDSFSRATVSGTSTAGFVGICDAPQTFTNCYYAGAVFGAKNALSSANATSVNSYYLGGSATDGNGALSMLQINMTASSFVSTLNNGRNGVNTVWFFDSATTNAGYPQFNGVTSWLQVGERVAKGAITEPSGGTGSVYLGGNGTKAAPFTIDTPEALAYLTYLVKNNLADNNGNKHAGTGSHYKLTANIDLSGEYYVGAGMKLDWYPIGPNKNNPFRGSLDGDLKTITNLSMSAGGQSDGFEGLFGYVRQVSNEASVHDLYLSNVVLERSTSEQSGAVAGAVEHVTGTGAVIQRVGVLGGSTVKGMSAGGLVGMDVSTGIKTSLYHDVFSRATVVARFYAGGIVGEAKTSQKFENVYFAGSSSRTTIEGAKKANDYKNVYAQEGSGAVQGGAVLVLPAAQMQLDAFTSSLNGTRVGKEAPWSPDLVEINAGYPHFGGFSFTTWEQVGRAVAAGTIQEPSGGAGSVAVGGAGTVDDPFTIDSPEALAYLSHLFKIGEATYTAPDVYFSLEADIDLAGENYVGEGKKLEWLPIGTDASKFKSNFDGKQHVVKNLTITAAYSPDNGRTGLFGTVAVAAGSTTSISDVLFDNVALENANSTRAGSLAGYILGDGGRINVSRIGVRSGTVRGNAAGGLIGREGSIAGRFFLADSFSRAQVQGSASGGISGQSFAAQSYSNCYFAGPKTGSKPTYAFSGSNMGTFTNCYFEAGTVGNITQGVSKTEAQMKGLETAALLGTYARIYDGTSPWFRNISGSNGGYPAFDFAVKDWGDVGAGVGGGKIVDPQTGTGTSVKWAGGAGTSGDPYVIDSPESLAWVAYTSLAGQHPSACYMKIDSDLDLAGEFYAGAGNKLEWLPIGTATNPFSARFDGSLFTIENLTMQTGSTMTEQVGLFGSLGASNVSNLYLKGVKLNVAPTTTNTVTGPLAGNVKGNATITKVGVISAEVHEQTAASTFATGGLIGEVRTVGTSGSLTVKDCFSRATIVRKSAGTSMTSRGGIAGYSTSAARYENCYFAGKGAYRPVTGFNTAGTIVNVFYEAGSVEITGQATSKTTTELKALAFATTLNAGRQDKFKAWYPDLQGKNKNDGYACFDFTATNWGDVGYAIDEGLLLNTASGKGHVKFAGGTGTQSNPYLIDSPEGLAYMSFKTKRSAVDYDNKHYKLIADIDLAGSAYVLNPGDKLEWAPIGGYYEGSNKPFFGNFNGDFHIVSNMALFSPQTGTETSGFFGMVGYDTVIQNLYLKNPTITRPTNGSVLFTGALVGHCGANNRGGTAKTTTIEIKKSGVIGGTLVVSGSLAPSNSGVGGLVGAIPDSGTYVNINDCFSRIRLVTYSDLLIGGLVGRCTPSYATVSNSYFANNVTNTKGSAYSLVANPANVTLNNCYSESGAASGTGGVMQGTTKSYFEMMRASFAFDLSNDRVGDSKTWYTDGSVINSGYPVFSFYYSNWEDVGYGVNKGWITKTSSGEGSVKFAGGSGTSGDPYLINSPEGLAWLSWRVKNNDSGVYQGKYFMLVADIDLAGYAYTGTTSKKLDWLPIGNINRSFDSAFDGGLYTITNLNMETGSTGTEYMGLFGAVGNTTLKNLYLSNVYLRTTPSKTTSVAGPLVGVMVGAGSSSISKVGVISGAIYSTYTMNSASGGLIGWIKTPPTNNVAVQDVFSRASLYSSGNPSLGGIVGYASSTQQYNNCYFAGQYAVKSIVCGGGITGSNNYYLDTSTNSGGGQGTSRTAANMRAAAFIGNLNNGRTGLSMAWFRDAQNKNDGFPLFDFQIVDWGDVGVGVARGDIKTPSSGTNVKFAGGNGSQNSPYLIDSPEALAFLGYLVNTNDTSYGVMINKYFKMTADIDLSGERYAGAGNKLKWVPIGTFCNDPRQYAFRSNFDGGFFTVSNCSIPDDGSTDGHDGLFGFVSPGAESYQAAITIQNLYLKDFELLRAGASAAGPLAGIISGDKRNIVIKKVGALPGTVKAKYAGGLVGNEWSNGNTVTFADCFSRANLVKNGSAGSQSGGIYGTSAYTQYVKNCYFAGSGADRAIDGSNRPTSFSNNYYQDSSVTGTGSMGATKKLETDMRAGSFVKLLNNNTTDNPWDIDLIGTNGVYKNDQYPLFERATWEKVGAAVDNGDIDSPAGGTGSVKFASGAGTVADPYIINTPEALAWLSFLVKELRKDADGKLYSSKAYTLAADMDLKGEAYSADETALEWLPIGNFNKLFTGTFDGGFSTVSNLTMVKQNGITPLGLIGAVTTPATIKNIYLSDVKIAVPTTAGARQYVGGVVGYVGTSGPAGTVTLAQCGVISGSIAAASNATDNYTSVGGVMGLPDVGSSKRVVYTNCFSRATVSGPNASRGGLVGRYFSGTQTIENSYVAGSGHAGVFYGGTGSMAVTNSYYLNTMGGTAQGTAKTEAQLKAWNTPYELGGKKFMGMTNVASTIWTVDDSDVSKQRNGGYPVFGNLHPQDWGVIGRAVQEGSIVGEGFKMTGLGTLASPYLISTPEALAQMAYLVNNDNQSGTLYWRDKVYKVTADLDLRGHDYSQAEKNLEWQPIGRDMNYSGASSAQSQSFKGTFDGGLHTISHFTMTGAGPENTHSEFCGLFGVLGGGANVSSLYLDDVTLTRTTAGNRAYSGSLAAIVDNNLDTNKPISISKIGVKSGNIHTTTPRYSYAGGLVGYIVSRSTPLVSVDSVFVRDTEIVAENSTPAASGAEACRGGLFGASISIGGASKVLIKNSYVALKANIEYPMSGNSPTGNIPTIENSYYAPHNLSTNVQGTPQTEAELKAWSTPFVLNGNKFVGIKNVSSTVWATDALDAATQVNGGFPLFGNLYPQDWSSIGQAVEVNSLSGAGFRFDAQGNGSQSNPYLISTPEALAHLGYATNQGNAKTKNKHFKMTADLDLAGAKYGKDGTTLEWVPIGTDANGFSSSFSGDLFVIDNMTMTAAGVGALRDKSGLFGTIKAGVGAPITIEKIYFENVLIDRPADAQAGPLAGSIAPNDVTTISQIGVISGSVKAKDAVGGIAGTATASNAAHLETKDCFSRVSLEDAGSAGGLYGGGFAGLAMQNSYFAGTGAKHALVSDGSTSTSIIFTNCYYLDSSLVAGGTPQCVSKTEYDMMAWKFASTLNSAPSSGVWTTDAYTVLGDGTKQWRNGGLPLFGTLAALNWEEVGKRVQEDVITQPSSGTSVKPLNIDDPDAGTEANPFQIDSAEALAWYSYCLKSNVFGASFGDSWITLTEDVDLSGEPYTDDASLKLDWLPIGFSGAHETDYRGQFDGGSHRIVNLTITTPPTEKTTVFNLGLFGEVSGATIKDLTLSQLAMERSDETGKSTAAGGLIGAITSASGKETHIERVGVTDGTVKVTKTAQTSSVLSAGGLVGHASSSMPVTIKNCYSRVQLEGTAGYAEYFAAGLVGSSYAAGPKIESSYFAGSGAAWSLVGLQRAESGIPTYANAFYLDASLSSGGKDQGTRLTSGQLTGWGAAYQLNDGTESVLDSTMWRKAHLVGDAGSQTLENGGFPVLIQPSDQGDDAHMDAAQNWGEVGAWVGLFGGNGNRPADVSADRYIAAYPETLAWYAAVLNDDATHDDYAEKELAFAKPLDFSGKKYKATATDSDPEPLAWTPMGDTEGHAFAGTIDGGRNAAVNLRVVAGTGSTDTVSGLVGFAADGATFLGVTIGSRGGEMLDAEGNPVADKSSIEGNVFAGGIVGATAGSLGLITFIDCENHAPVTVKSAPDADNSMKAAGGIMGMSSGAGAVTTFTRCVNTGDVSSVSSAGGISGDNEGSVSIKDCYNRGTISGEVAGVTPTEAGSVGGLAGAKTNPSSLTVASSYNAAELVAGTIAASVSGELVGAVWTSRAQTYNAYDSTIHDAFNATAETHGAEIDGMKGYATEKMTAPMPNEAVQHMNAGRKPKSEDALNPAPWGVKASVNDSYPSFEDSLNMNTDSWIWVGFEQKINELYMADAITGKGTEADPYVFKTPEAFAWWNYNVNYNADANAMYFEGGQILESDVVFSASHARLGADLDMTGAAYKTAGGMYHSEDDPLKWTPIASLNGSVFTGTFNGQDAADGTLHRITNLLASSEDGDKKDAALFGKVGMNGTLSFVTFGENCKAISVGEGTTAAMLAVRLDTGAKANDIVVEAGGSAPYNNEVEGDSRAAGIAASLSADANITRSSNEASITAKTGTAGGIGADISGGTGSTILTDVRNSGSVTTLGTGASAAAAGIVSGLTGRANVTSTYSTGQVGSPVPTITAPNKPGFAFPMWHGVADKTTLLHALYLEGSAGTENETGDVQGFKATHDDLKSWGAAYELNLRTDASGKLIDNVSNQHAWRMAKDESENNGYPMLIVVGDGNDQQMTAASDWNDVGRWSVVFGGETVRPPVAGLGNGPDNPIVLSTPMHLAWMAYQVSNDDLGALKWSNKHYQLGADIDLTGTVYTGATDGAKLNWSPIGATEDHVFKGSFNGGRRTITSLSMQETHSDASATEKLAGLFGAIETSSLTTPSVSDLYVKNPVLQYSLAASPVYAGPIAGSVSSGSSGRLLERVGVINDGAAGGGVVAVGRGAAGGLVGRDAVRAVAATSYENVFSRVALGGAAPVATTGGLVGSTAEKQIFVNSYFAGSGAAFAVAGGAGAIDETAAANCYYLENSLEQGRAEQGAAKRTQAEMTKWNFAYELNNKQFVNDAVASTVWTTDITNPFFNEGMPIFGDLDPINWEEVGRQVQAGVITQPTSGTSQKPTNVAEAGAGDSPSKPYLIDSPEALAWFSYMVKTKPNEFASKHVALAGSVDLKGSDYVGASLRMEWLPIGGHYGGRDIWFSGTFDGNLNAVSGLSIQRELAEGESAALFGNVRAAGAGLAVATLQRVYFDDVLLTPTAAPHTTAYIAPLAGRVSGSNGVVTVSRVGVRARTVGDSKVQPTIEPSGDATLSISGLLGKTTGPAGSVLVEDSFSRASFAPDAGAMGLVGLGSSGAQVMNSYFAGENAESFAAAHHETGCWYLAGSIVSDAEGTPLESDELKGRIDIASTDVDPAPAGGTNVIDLLNTTTEEDGTPIEYPAADRRWFPTADSGPAAMNGGYPTFTPPLQRFAKEVDPADAVDGPIRMSLDGTVIDAPTLLRNPRLIDLGRADVPMEPSWTLGDVEAVSDNHKLWQSGWTDQYTADKKIGLSLPQGEELGDLSKGLAWTPPAAADELVVGIASAYAYPTARAASVMLADSDGNLYELMPTIREKDSSTLDVTVQMQTNTDAFALFPDGKAHETNASQPDGAGTKDFASFIKNNSTDVAAMGSVNSITPLQGANLVVLPLTAVAPVDNLNPINNGENALLGMRFTDTTDVDAPQGVDVVYDAAKTAPLMFFTLTGGSTVSFQTYMKYSGLWQGEQARFGYSFGYTFTQPTGDLSKGEEAYLSATKASRT